jgi:hypothetical protein
MPSHVVVQVLAYRAHMVLLRIDEGDTQEVYEIHSDAWERMSGQAPWLTAQWLRQYPQHHADGTPLVVHRLIGIRVLPEDSSKVSRTDWLDVVSRIVPKSIREPWLGDLREDRGKWRRDGCSPRSVFWCTAGQLLVLALRASVTVVKDFISSTFRSAG